MVDKQPSRDAGFATHSPPTRRPNSQSDGSTRHPAHGFSPQTQRSSSNQATTLSDRNVTLVTQGGRRARECLVRRLEAPDVTHRDEPRRWVGSYGRPCDRRGLGGALGGRDMPHSQRTMNAVEPFPKIASHAASRARSTRRHAISRCERARSAPTSETHLVRSHSAGVA